MHVTYRLERGDYWAFAKYVYRSTKTYWLYLIPLVVAPLVLLTTVDRGDLSPGVNLAIILAIDVLLGLFLYSSLKRRAMNAAKGRPGLLDEQTMTISPEGLCSKATVGEGTVFWAGVHSVGDDKQHIYLMIAKNLGYIVPKRAFKSPEEAQEFLALAQEYWGKKPA